MSLPKFISNNKFLVILISLLILVILFSNPEENQKSIDSPLVDFILHQRNTEETTRHILVWTDDVHNDKWGIYGQTFNKDFFNDCPSSNCIITADRNFMDEYKYDAVVFNADEFHKDFTLPTKRSPHQLYVFGVAESPSRQLFEINNFVFNYTCE